MNEQQFFDEALSHIRQQGEPSVKEDTGFGVSASFCVYNGPDGRRCAFGPAIMTFDPTMEGEAADSYPKDNLHEWARDLSDALVSNVQSAHDIASRLFGTKFLAAFERNMKAAAHDYNAVHDYADRIVYRPPA